MKNKLLALAVILLLFTSVFAAGFRSAFATEWRILTISYLPSGMPAPATVPALGTYNLSMGSKVVLEAPDLVYADDAVRYKFDAWCFYNEETEQWTNKTTNPYTLTLNYNYTAYARYKIQYKVTVEVPSSPDWEANFTALVYYPVDSAYRVANYNNASVSVWVYNGSRIKAGVSGQFLWCDPLTPSVYRKGRTAIAKFTNWSDVGYYLSGDIAWSNWINVTGPTYPEMEWSFYYLLNVRGVKDSTPFSPYRKAVKTQQYDATTYYPIKVTVEDIGTAIRWTFDFFAYNTTPMQGDGHFAGAVIISFDGSTPAFQIHDNDGTCSAYPWGTWLYSPYDPTGGGWYGWHTSEAAWNTPVDKLCWVSAEGARDFADNPEGKFVITIDKSKLASTFYWAVYANQFAFYKPNNGYSCYPAGFVWGTNEVFTKAELNPPVTVKEGWYEEDEEVTLSESKVYPFTGGRWAPKYWEVDGVIVPPDVVGTPSCVVYCNYNYTAHNLTITVKMDANHTAVIHYARQWYLTFQDNGWHGFQLGASGVSQYSGYYFENINYTFTAPPYTNETECRRWRFWDWYVTPTIGWYGANLTNRDLTLNVTCAMTITAYYKLQYKIRLFTEPLALMNEGISLKLEGDIPKGSGWFDYGSRASFGAPRYFGETEWNNGTRYRLDGWYWDYPPDGRITTANETYYDVFACKNFTAVYKKQFKVEVSAEPADWTWEKTYWAWADGVTTWFWDPDTSSWTQIWALYTWPDPKGLLKYYFVHWEVTEGPSAGLPDPTYQYLKLNMTSPYKVVAIYRNGTALIADPDEAYFVGAGGAFCKEFEVTMMILNIEGMYSAEFKLTWNSEYLELVAVDTSPLDEVWTNYFVAKGDDVPATPGEYEFVATAVGNDTEPFSGTAALVTLTFHIIKEPEVPGTYVKPIHIAFKRFLNKTRADISIDYTGDAQYTIETPKPYLKMSAKIEDCGSTMIVYIEAQNVTRLYEYQLKISYPSSQLKVVDITVEKTFLQGPYSTQSITFDGGYITIHVKQASGVPPANGTGILVVITFEILVEPGASITPLTWDATNTWIREIKDCSGGSTTFNPPWLRETEWPKQIPGDANMDGTVDIFDLRLVALYYGKSYPPADFDKDGKVDLDDLLITAIHFGQSMYE